MWKMRLYAEALRPEIRVDARVSASHGREWDESGAGRSSWAKRSCDIDVDVNAGAILCNASLLQ